MSSFKNSLVTAPLDPKTSTPQTGFQFNDTLKHSFGAPRGFMLKAAPKTKENFKDMTPEDRKKNWGKNSGSGKVQILRPKPQLDGHQASESGGVSAANMRTINDDIAPPEKQLRQERERKRQQQEQIEKEKARKYRAEIAKNREKNAASTSSVSASSSPSSFSSSTSTSTSSSSASASSSSSRKQASSASSSSTNTSSLVSEYDGEDKIQQLEAEIATLKYARARLEQARGTGPMVPLAEDFQLSTSALGIRKGGEAAGSGNEAVVAAVLAATQKIASAGAGAGEENVKEAYTALQRLKLEHEANLGKIQKLYYENKWADGSSSSSSSMGVKGSQDKSQAADKEVSLFSPVTTGIAPETLLRASQGKGVVDSNADAVADADEVEGKDGHMRGLQSFVGSAKGRGGKPLAAGTGRARSTSPAVGASSSVKSLTLPLSSSSSSSSSSAAADSQRSRSARQQRTVTVPMDPFEVRREKEKQREKDMDGIDGAATASLDKKRSESISKKKALAYLQEIKDREDKELNLRFKANPIPATTQMELYQEMLKEQAKKSEELKRKVKDETEKLLKPFSFELSKMVEEKRAENVKQREQRRKEKAKEQEEELLPTERAVEIQQARAPFGASYKTRLGHKLISTVAGASETGLQAKKKRKQQQQSSSEKGFKAKEIPWTSRVELLEAKVKVAEKRRARRIAERARKLLEDSQLPARMQEWEDKRLQMQARARSGKDRSGKGKEKDGEEDNVEDDDNDDEEDEDEDEDEDGDDGQKHRGVAFNAAGTGDKGGKKQLATSHSASALMTDRQKKKAAFFQWDKDYTFRPTVTKEIPDYDGLFASFQSELRKRKKANAVKPTKVKVFACVEPVEEVPLDMTLVASIQEKLNKRKEKREKGGDMQESGENYDADADKVEDVTAEEWAMFVKMRRQLRKHQKEQRFQWDKDYTFSPLINPSIPNYTAMQQAFARKLSRRKEANKKAPVATKDFEFMTREKPVKQERVDEATVQRAKEEAELDRRKREFHALKLKEYFKRSGVDPLPVSFKDKALAETLKSSRDEDGTGAGVNAEDDENEGGHRGMGSFVKSRGGAKGKSSGSKANPVSAKWREQQLQYAAWKVQMKEKIECRPTLMERATDSEQIVFKRKKALLKVKEALDRQGLTNYSKWFDPEELELLQLEEVIAI